MSMQTKTIGRMPTDHGPYDPQLAYGKKFTVTLFDCGWESKHDNNTSAPATLNAQAGTITENTTDWKKVWGSYKQWLIDNGYQKMDASDVKDGNNTQHDINVTFASEIGSDSTPESIKGRVTNLEEAVGTGGSVDERIATEGAKHYLKSETYTKEEVNGMITTPEQGFVSVSATSETTAATDVLPATGEADTIYRVANWDGSQYDTSVYSEYSWNTSTNTYIKLSTKQVGIDDVPTAGSNNLVKSGGVKSNIDQLYKDVLRGGTFVFRGKTLNLGGGNVSVGIGYGPLSVKVENKSNWAGYFSLTLIGSSENLIIPSTLFTALETKTFNFTLSTSYYAIRVYYPNNNSMDITLEGYTPFQNDHEKFIPLYNKANPCFTTVNINSKAISEAKVDSLNIYDINNNPRRVYYRIRTTDNSNIDYINLLVNNSGGSNVRKTFCPLDTWLSYDGLSSERVMWLYIKTLGAVDVYVDYSIEPIKTAQRNLPENIVIVDASGKGDYLSVDDALGDVKDSVDNPVTILVAPGVYTSIMRTPNREPYEIANRYVSIIGMDRNNCILKNSIGYYSPYTEDTPGEVWDDAVLRLGGNITIENLTILSVDDGYDAFMQEHPTFGVSHRTAYCIHLDSDCPQNSRRTIRNCRLISNHACAIGCGTRENNTIEIINCEIESTIKNNTAADGGIGTTLAPFYAHSYNMESGNTYPGQRILIKDSILINHTTDYCFRVYASVPDTIECTLINDIMKSVNTENSFKLEGGALKSELCFGNNVESANN